MPVQRIDLPQGTLDLLILRTLGLGPQHGWGISERVQQMSSDVLRINEGSALSCAPPSGAPRMDQTPLGNVRKQRAVRNLRADQRTDRKQLEAEKDSWNKLTAAVAQVLRTRLGISTCSADLAFRFRSLFRSRAAEAETG